MIIEESNLISKCRCLNKQNICSRVGLGLILTLESNNIFMWFKNVVLVINNKVASPLSSATSLQFAQCSSTI